MHVLITKGNTIYIRRTTDGGIAYKYPNTRLGRMKSLFQFEDLKKRRKQRLVTQKHLSNLTSQQENYDA